MQLFHFWSRDVHPVKNLMLCTKFNENRMIFNWLRYGDISIFKMAAVRHLGIRDHPRSLCCWPQLPVKFHVNLIHRSEDRAIWIFRIFGLKCLFRLPKWGFWGTLDPINVTIHQRPPKGTSLHKSASFKLSTVIIRWGVWPVDELTESVTDTHTQVNLYLVHALHSIGQTIKFELWERWISITLGAWAAFHCVQWHFNKILTEILSSAFTYSRFYSPWP